MYTESELRELLHTSADRVRTEDRTSDTDPLSAMRTADELGSRRRARRRRQLVAPIAVAACTAALVTGVVMLAQRPSTDHAALPAGATHPAATPSHASHRVVPSQRATLTVPVVDDVAIDTRNSTENYVGKVDGGHGQQVITSQLPDGRAINLVIAPSFAFDDSKLSHDHPVTIGGTTGHYSILRLFPLSDGGDGGSAPTGTIVFRTPDGHWAFAWLQAGTDNGNAQGTPVDDPSAIVRGFDTLHARFASGTDRTPIRLGYLPAGATFDDADLDAAHSHLVVASLTTVSGNKQMDIDLLAPSPTSRGPVDNSTTCFKAVGCVVHRGRNLPDGFLLSVNGTNYSAAETQKVLDHVTVASDPDDPSTYFLLTEAIG